MKHWRIADATPYCPHIAASAEYAVPIILWVRDGMLGITDATPYCPHIAGSAEYAVPIILWARDGMLGIAVATSYCPHIAASAEYAVPIILWARDGMPRMWSRPTNAVCRPRLELGPHECCTHVINTLTENCIELGNAKCLKNMHL